MIRTITLTAAVFLAAVLVGDARAQQRDLRHLDDHQVRQLMIAQSIARHDGDCACPYSLTADGSRCGKRSAYSRSGGNAPLCYADDIDYRTLQQYRAR